MEQIRVERGDIMLELVSGLAYSNYNLPGKLVYLLSRGVSVRARDQDGNSCLQHLFERCHRVGRRRFPDSLGDPKKDYLKDIIILLITGGADVYAVNDQGTSVSQSACQFQVQDEWAQSLRDCGYEVAETKLLHWNRRLENAYSTGVEETELLPVYHPGSLLSLKAYLDMRQARGLDSIIQRMKAQYPVEGELASNENSRLATKLHELFGSEDREVVGNTYGETFHLFHQRLRRGHLPRIKGHIQSIPAMLSGENTNRKSAEKVSLNHAKLSIGQGRFKQKQSITDRRRAGKPKSE